MVRPVGKLTPTSYAVLGMLALRPWSAYELNQHWRSSPLRAIWPRAESHLYSEPKHLAEHGLVTAKVEERSGRRRTVYRITRKGRQELRNWLSKPVTHFGDESVSMLQMAFADLATQRDIDRMLDTLQGYLFGDAEWFLDVVQERLAQGFPFPERVHVHALVDRFLLEIVEARIRWVAFAEQFIRDCAATDSKQAAARKGEEEFRTMAARLEEMISVRDEAAPASEPKKARKKRQRART